MLFVMRYLLLALLGFIASCASIDDRESVAPISAQARSELAPTGTLRVGLNLSATILAVKDSATGEMRGVGIDIARELGRRAGVPVRFVAYATGGLDKSIDADEWDVAFFAVEPSRAQKVSFSPAYAEIDTTYLVRGDAPMSRGGRRSQRCPVAISRGAGYESALAGTLKQAKLLRTDSPSR